MAEFQARGLIHVHAVMRLDGPDGPDTPPAVDVDAIELGVAIDHAARTVRLEVTPNGHQPVALRWGEQVDVRHITLGAGRDDQTGDVHPEMVAACLAKYLTKSTEEFGLDGHGRVHSAVDARYLGASPHAARIIETAEQLARDGGEDYARLADRYGTLGYRGHVLTKTRRYSTTFGALRRARSDWRRAPRRPAGLDPGATVREVPADDDQAGDAADIVVERQWRYVGSGYLDADTAARAMTAAALARSRWTRPGAPRGCGLCRAHSASFTVLAGHPLTGGAGGSRAAEAKKCRRASFPAVLVRRALDAPVEPVTITGWCEGCGPRKPGSERNQDTRR